MQWDFVGDQRYFDAVRLQGKSARNPKPDISQAILLKTIILENTELEFPPSVLASLPLIIKDPSNLKYNRGISATKETIMAMLDLTYYDPPVTLEILLPNGTTVEKTYPACTSTVDIGNDLLGEMGIDVSCVSLVRQFNETEELRIPCCNMPIGVFNIPGAKWTVELRHLPEQLKATKENVQMLKLYLLQRAEEINADKSIRDLIFPFVNSFLAENVNLTDADTEKLGKMLHDLNTMEKFEGFRAKNFRTGEINIQRYAVEKDGRLRTKRNSMPCVYYDAADVIVHKTKSGWDLQYGDKTFFIPLERIKIFFEFINLSMIPIWESIPKRSFKFESPERPESLPEGTIPRAYEDSRINHIKPEYLQRVIDEQLEFAKKFTK